MPLPNDLWFAGSADGTLTPPTSADPIQAALDAQLDGLDGWSTVAPIRFPFSEAIDPTTVTLGSSVRLFQVTLVAAAAFVGGPVDVVVRELDAAEVAATVGDAGQSIVLTPLAPLAPQSAYTAVVTREVRGTSGIPVAPAGPFAEALLGPALAPSDAQFELQQRLQAEAQALAPFGIDADQIASTTTFSTQSIDSVQQALVAIAKGEEAEFVAQLQLDAPFLDFSAPLAEAAPAATVGVEGVVDLPLPDGIPIWLSRFHRGWLEVPYYLDAPAERASVNGDTSILTSRFRTRFQFGPDDDARHTTRFNPLPAVRSVQRIPMLITEPLTAPKPATGWPVLVFQHGITGDRANLQALSITLGAARIAAVAIDLPLHGITNDEDPLFAGFDSGADGVRERHFGLDALTVADDGEQQLGEDGQPDPSGAHFIQFESLVTTRDHVKQAVADLLQLLSVLEQVDLDGDGLGDFDTSQVYFVGHSLGAVVGAEFLP
ncbi:MAG: Ig-like domain-containing protein, partial [Planctomycetota bacterium]